MRAEGIAIAALAATACGSATIGDPPVADAVDEGAPDGAPILDAPPGPDARPCTAGDAREIDPMTGHCLVYVEQAVTWPQAAAACVALGGHLAVPTSLAENSIANGLSLTPATLPDVWLGASDLDLEMDWTWVTGEAFVFDNWRTGEPNDGNSDTVAEDCMIIETDVGGTWDDRPCDRVYPYLCELP